MPLSEVTDALQVFLGSQYVNDFDFNNRAYRVYVQADQKFRNDPDDAGAVLRARRRRRRWCRCRTWCTSRETTAPQVISHFNLFRSAEINGAAAPGYSSGQALQAMQKLAEQNAPDGHDVSVGRSVARRDQGRHAGRPDLRPGPAARLPDARRRSTRASCCRSSSCSAVPVAVLGARRRAGPARAGQRHLLPGRTGHADRPRGEERDPDRRVRRAAARARAVDCRGRRSRRRASGCARFS